MNFVFTLTCHQIAGFLAVVIDGQTFNFGTDLVLLTPSNNPGNEFGPMGMWGFANATNPWAGAIMFEFDCGDPSNASQPFPYLLSGASAVFAGPSTFNFDSGESYPQVVGSMRWTPTCLQRGRSKVHVLTHYSPFNDSVAWPATASAPSPYVMGGGRLPTIEFKIAGRIVLDYRVVTAWRPLSNYAQYTYVLAVGANGQVCIFVQMAGSVGVSAATIPNFASVAFGGQIVDGICTWQNAGVPIYAAGSSSSWPSGQTNLNNPNSNKLGGLGRTALIGDAWVGNMSTAWADSVSPRVIEAPHGWLQKPSGIFVTGLNRPDFDTSSPPQVGKVTLDALGSWICLGRSKNATCLPDSDGTWNTGGFSNPALCLADYLQSERAEFGLGATLTSDSIATVVAAANICDEKVTIAVY